MNKEYEFKLIVAGGRDFNDYQLLGQSLDKLVSELPEEAQVSIVSGMARGADALGVRFAIKHNVILHRFPADWDKYGKAAGYRRNADMGAIADGLIAFWDEKSKGTQHMINIMNQLNKLVVVVTY